MTPKKKLQKILDDHKAGDLSRNEALQALTAFVDPGAEFGGEAIPDFSREERAGFPEAIYGAGKTPEQVVRIFQSFREQAGKALATRCSDDTLKALKRAIPGIQINAQARVAWITPTRSAGTKTSLKAASALPGSVAVLAAGTSDLPVAEEAAITLEFGGVNVQRFSDIGVAGIHRLLNRVRDIRAADVVIAVAGMEGALPSVVGGLVAVPVIAVPTSVGYGASFQGLTALLAMLNSCSAGITVVNIDNGFGAAVAAVRVLRGKTA